METKHLLYRKKISAARLAVFLTGFAACAFAAGAADRGLELRQRLDSIEVETQARKRLGNPIEDLEAASAELRDSLVGLRGNAPRTAAPQEDKEEGFSYLGNIPFLEDILAFRPNGAFDWVIVGTGAVALLSGLMLLIGLFAGRKKKRAAAPKKQQVSRKINLAPTSTLRAVTDINNQNEAPPRDSVAEFQALVENLRKVAPPVPSSAGAPFPFAAREQEPRASAPPPAPVEPEQRKAVPPLPPPEPPPLIVNAPDTPPTAPPLAGLSGKPLASEVLSARTPPAPPPARPPVADSQSKPPSAGAGFPAFNDLVIVAAKDGLDELEISRRYQLSIDQVRLILRMEYNKTKKN